MKYYATYDNGALISIGSTSNDKEIDNEISFKEYNSIISEIQEKVKLAENVFNGIISIRDIGNDWVDEITDMVSDMENEKNKLTAEEALSIITGGEI